MRKDMASYVHVFGPELPNVSRPRKQISLLERRKLKETTMKPKAPRKRSSLRSQELGRPKDRSAFFQKPKLYSQAAYIGSTDVEPFSSFKSSQVSDPGQEEEGFPTPMCRVLGCWQTESHSHDLPNRLETGSRGNVPHVPKPHITIVGGISKIERENRSLVGRIPLRPPSPLVAGPACLSDRIVEPLPARSHYRLRQEPTKPPSNPPLESHGPLSSSSILQPALAGTRDLRDALPLSSTSYLPSHPRILQPITWQVDLPVHPKPSKKRKLESEGPRDRAIFEALSSRSFRDPTNYDSKEEASKRSARRLEEKKQP